VFRAGFSVKQLPIEEDVPPPERSLRDRHRDQAILHVPASADLLGRWIASSQGAASPYRNSFIGKLPAGPQILKIQN